MKFTRISGFTLIELLVAITIFFLISLMAFAPYSFYLNKSKVKHTGKEISQAIYDAKNKAKNGSATASGNISLGLYFDTAEQNKYTLYSFPYNIEKINILPANGTVIETSSLQPGIQFESIGGENKGMIFFRSITSSGLILTGDTFSEDTNSSIGLEYSFKGASYGLLRGKLEYFTETQIVDY